MPHASQSDQGTWLARARDAYDALMRHFAVANGALFREHAPARLGDRRYSFLWPFSQALAAALDMGELAQARLLWQSFFEHYWDERPGHGGASYPFPTGGHTFYDDNCWIGLALIALHRATGDPRALADAARVFGVIAGAWDDDPAHPAPGGVFWAEPAANRTRDRNTVSNAPAAQLALHLHALTGDDAYLAWARRMFAWVERYLRDPADGLYWDHIALDGAIERTKWSYNQGTMLGAAALFGAYAGDAALLERARAIAAAALRHYGEDDRLWRQDPAFNAIFFHNLRLLGAAPGDHGEYLPALTAYAGRIWAEGRDPQTGLCDCGRGRPVGLLQQAAAVQVFALLAADEANPPAAAEP